MDLLLPRIEKSYRGVEFTLTDNGNGQQCAEKVFL